MSLENGCALFVGMMCLLIAGYYFFSRKPITIYNQSQPPRIEDLKDVRKYNRATALLMAIYGLIFVLEGILIKKFSGLSGDHDFNSHARYCCRLCCL